MSEERDQAFSILAGLVRSRTVGALGTLHAGAPYVSLVPFATAWIARTQLASAPVAVYAAIFVCVNIAYLVFERQVLRQADTTLIPERARRMARRRSLATLSIFVSAMLVSLYAPRVGFALICCSLLTYLTPEAPDAWL